MKLFQNIRGLFLSKFFHNPFYIRIHVTNRCNYKCIMCYNSRANYQRSKELSLADYEKIAKILKRLRVPNIVLTGGEPFLRKDIVEIIELFSKKYGFSIRIQTNGGEHINNDLIDKIVKIGGCEVSVSIDSLDRNKHDFICNKKGAWDSAVRTLLTFLKKIPHGWHIVNTVASSYNLFELPHIVEYFNRLGLFIHITPLMFLNNQNKSLCFRGRCPEFMTKKINDKEIDAVYSKLIKYKRRGYRILNSYQHLIASANYFKTGDCKWNCNAGEFNLDISTDGFILPCKEYFTSFNVLEENFIKIYKSSQYKDKIKEIKKDCPGCLYGESKEISLLIKDNLTLLEFIIRYIQFKFNSIIKI